MFSPYDVWSHEAIYFWSFFSSIGLPIVFMYLCKNIISKQRYHALIMFVSGVIIQLVFCPWKLPDQNGTVGFMFVWNLFPFEMNTSQVMLNTFICAWASGICYYVKQDSWHSESRSYIARANMWWCDVCSEIRESSLSKFKNDEFIVFLYELQRYITQEFYRIKNIPISQRNENEKAKFNKLEKAHKAFNNYEIISALEAIETLQFKYGGQYISIEQFLKKHFANYIEHREKW